MNTATSTLIEVPWIVGPAALERHDVVNDVAGAGTRGLPGRGAWVVVLEVPLGRLAPLDPAVAVAGDADWGVSRGVAGERSAPRREMRCRWKRGRVVGVRRAPGVRRDVVAAPGGVAVDVDAAGRAMAR